MSETIEIIGSIIILILVYITVIFLIDTVTKHGEEVEKNLTAPIIKVDRQIIYNNNRYRLSSIEEQDNKIVLNVYKIEE